MTKKGVPAPPKRSAVDNVASIFEARRDLRPATRPIVRGSGLSVDEADMLIFLHGIKLGWPEPCPNYDGYVNFTDLKSLLVHDPALFTRRIKKLATAGLVHVRPSRQGDPTLHAKAQQVRIEAAGTKAVAPLWERYSRFCEDILKGFTKAELDAHLKVNKTVSRLVRDKLDPAKQLLNF